MPSAHVLSPQFARTAVTSVLEHQAGIARLQEQRDRASISTACVYDRRGSKAGIRTRASLPVEL